MEINKIYQGDCLEVLKTFPDNSVDSVVTDPPYFLVNETGNGFMNKEWDSIINLWIYIWLNEQFVKNVINLLTYCRIEKNGEEEYIVQKNVNMTEGESKEIKENAQFAKKYLKLNDVLKNASVHLIALTKQEVLVLLKESSITHIKILEEFLNGEKENVLYVIPILFPKKEINNIVVKNVTRLLKVEECQEKEIIFTKMEIVKIKNVIVEMNGKLLEKTYTNEITGLVDFVENIVGEKKFNATILFPIKSEELMKNLTLLLYAYFVTQSLSKTPQNIINNFLKLIFQECWRVIKPGGHLLSFGGTRTYHRMCCAIEDAGFEIRDQIQWIYGSGFPKSLDIGKAIDRSQGNKRESLGISKNGSGAQPNKLNNHQKGDTGIGYADGSGKEFEITKGNTKWEGFGTNLKPANEPIVLARKPISEKTIAENVLKWGVGGINIDGCRIPYTPENPPISQLEQGKTEIKSNNKRYGRNSFNESKTKSTIGGNLKGRFPSNLILDGSEEVNSLFPIAKSGARSSKHHIGNEQGEMFNHGIYGKYKSKNYDDVPASEGSASRFFYCSKSSKSERNLGFENGTGSNTYNKKCLLCGKWQRKQSFSDDYTCHCEIPEYEVASGNNHPTVKPISLMKYLCKLITPPNGIILDPFFGSGSTAIAAKMEGFNWVGIEKEPEYCEIAKRRIKAV